MVVHQRSASPTMRTTYSVTTPSHALDERTELDRVVERGGEQPAADLGQVAGVGRLDDVVATDLLRALGVGAVGHGDLVEAGATDHPGLAGRGQLGTAGHLVPALGEQLDELPVGGGEVGALLG